MRRGGDGSYLFVAYTRFLLHSASTPNAGVCSCGAVGHGEGFGALAMLVCGFDCDVPTLQVV